MAKPKEPITFIDKNAWTSVNTKEPVPFLVRSLGGHIRLKPLTTAEVQALPKYVEGADPWPGNRETLRASIVNEDGTPFFTSEELDVLKDKHSHGVWSRIQGKIAELNGWTKDAEEDAKN